MVMPFNPDLHDKEVAKLESAAVAMFLNLDCLRDPSVSKLSEHVVWDKM